MISYAFYDLRDVAAAHKDLASPVPEPWHELRTGDAIQMVKCPSPETTV